jgi:hypothetical protein
MEKKTAILGIGDHIRQGDVLLTRTTRRALKGLKELPRENGRVVLAHGEATGHHHSIEDRGCKLFLEDSTRAAPDAMQVLSRIGGLMPDRPIVTDGPVLLTHQEHDHIEIVAKGAKGLHGRVSIQREYHPSELRNVAD